VCSSKQPHLGRLQLLDKRQDAARQLYSIASKNIVVIEFYLPQLWYSIRYVIRSCDANRLFCSYIIGAYECPPLHKFLVSTARTSVHFALQLYWILDSASVHMPGAARMHSLRDNVARVVGLPTAAPPDAHGVVGDESDLHARHTGPLPVDNPSVAGRFSSALRSGSLDRSASTSSGSHANLSANSGCRHSDRRPLLQNAAMMPMLVPPLPAATTDADDEDIVQHTATTTYSGGPADYFEAQLRVVAQLTAISDQIRELAPHARHEALRLHLTDLNSRNERAFLPGSKNRFHRIVNVLCNECVVFNTKERAPYMIYLELVTENDDGTEADETRTPPSSPIQPRQDPPTQLNARYEAAEPSSRAAEMESSAVQLSAASVLPSATSSAPAVAADSNETKPCQAEAQYYATAAFGESMQQKEERVRKSSAHSHRPSWHIVSVIVKSGDDLRQEQFALQLIAQFLHIFRRAKLPLWLRPYRIWPTSSNAGIIETIPNAVSLDALKRRVKGYSTLTDFFLRKFGARQSNGFKKAAWNFAKSMAAYSIVCYLLQVKDRHNGNILLDSEGHIMHIDFGFILSNSPGGINFESAPFKLTRDFVDLMGGEHSALFRHFRQLIVRGFLAARKSSEIIILLVEAMMVGHADFSCFKGGSLVIDSLRERFHTKLSKAQCSQVVLALIDRSTNHWRTRLYDRYQRCCVGRVLPNES
jgi:hypothetical protein